VRNKGAAYITKGGELQNWYVDPDFCGRISIGKEKNYFSSSRMPELARR
jgi:hypothetical protein